MKRAGFTREQADVIAKANAEAFQTMVVAGALATKRDIGNLKKIFRAPEWHSRAPKANSPGSTINKINRIGSKSWPVFLYLKSDIQEHAQKGEVGRT